jgi:predicted Fe-Mo cluster-binding NifX family protein
MKIAVACDGTNVTGHFGHCQSFRLFEADGGVIVGMEELPNPGHKPGFLPNLLADHGAEVIICGGMGGHAAEIFAGRGVAVVTGASGDAQIAAQRYLSGELVSSGELCQEHHHEHSHHHAEDHHDHCNQ